MDPITVNQLSDLTLVAIVLAFTGFLFWLGYRWYRVQTQVRLQRAEAFNRLLEKFGSAKEFTDFLQTEQGRQFVTDPLPAPRSSSHRVLRLTQTGIVLMALGIGSFLNAYRLRNYTDMHYMAQATDSGFWGIFGVMIGAGFLVTALVTYLLAKRWHLMNGNGKGQH